MKNEKEKTTIMVSTRPGFDSGDGSRKRAAAFWRSFPSLRMSCTVRETHRLEDGPPSRRRSTSISPRRSGTR